MISLLDYSTFLVLYSRILEHDANDTIKERQTICYSAKT